MKSLILTITFLISGLTFASAQNESKCDDKVFIDILLENLTGQWTADGSVRTEPVNYFISGNWALNHQFLEVYFKDTNKEPEYVARVFIGYDCLSERYVAHWLDNYGGRPSETLGYGIKKDNSIEFRFEYPDGPFINKFIYDRNTDSWTFHSTSKNKKGEWVDFGKLNLKRGK